MKTMTNRFNSKFRLTFLTIVTFVAFINKSYCAIPLIQEYYEIRTYHVSDKAQEVRVDAYLKDVFLPALHRAGIHKAGVFKPIESDTASFGKLIYVFIPFSTSDQFFQLPAVLEKDLVFTSDGKSFTDAEYNNPPFTRYESVFLKAFVNKPHFTVPTYTSPVSERIYELRSYESATEAKAVKKIEMFNQGGEIKLFESLGFNALFFGQVLVGSHKPNLMYMITFSDMASHDAHWKAFRDHPDWKKLSGMEEYKNTVSKASPFLLHPTSYSDI
jgi:hypothetical protein